MAPTNNDTATLLQSSSILNTKRSFANVFSEDTPASYLSTTTNNIVSSSGYKKMKKPRKVNQCYNPTLTSTDSSSEIGGNSFNSVSTIRTSSSYENNSSTMIRPSSYNIKSLLNNNTSSSSSAGSTRVTSSSTAASTGSAASSATSR